MSTGCLGAIRKDGLHPSTKRGSTLRKQVTQPLEYGATMLLENLGGDILSNLKDPFGERLAGQFFAMGKIGLISPCPFKRMDMAYSNSYESVLRPDLPLSAGTVSSVLKSVGCDREGQLRFIRNYYSGTEYIIFDGTRLVSHSLGELGYNHCGIDDPQMNLQYCFSLKPERAPVYFLCETGDNTDSSMLMTCLKEMGKNNVILIADKGYSSKANREWMTKNGIMYIVPLKRDDASIDYSPLNLSTMSGFEGVFKYHGRPIFYRTVQKMGQRAGRPSKDDPNNVASVAKEHVVLFFDQVLRSKEIMNAVGRNSDFAEIAERSPRMGTLTLATNSPLISGPEELYDTYKEREAIEDMNDAYKNVLGKNASHLQDPASYQEWLFVNHISLMLYYRVHNKIKAAGKVSSFSVEDVMDMARRLTRQKIGDQWLDHPGTKTNLSKLTEIFGDSIPKIES